MHCQTPKRTTWDSPETCIDTWTCTLRTLIGNIPEFVTWTTGSDHDMYTLIDKSQKIWNIPDFVTWTFRHVHTLMGEIPGLTWNVPDFVTWTLRHVHTLMGEIPGLSWNVPHFVTRTHSYGGNSRTLLECPSLCDTYTLLWGKFQDSPGMSLTL